MKKPLPDRHIPHWQWVVLIGVCFGVFANSMAGGFVWDDEVQVVRNERVRGPIDIPQAFGSAFWDFAVSGETRTNYYRPVQTLTYSVAHSLGGLTPSTFHVLSVVYHVLATLALFGILIELSFSAPAAFAATAMFAVHPVHSEAVAWIAGVPDVSAGAFYFISIWMFLRFLTISRGYWLWGSAVAFLLALFSKEMAITLPIVLLMVGAVRARKAHPAKVRLRTLMLPYVIVIGVYTTMRVRALGSLATTQILEAEWLDWISLGVDVVSRYIRYVVFPFPLNAYHLVPLRLDERVGEIWVALLILALVAWLGWRVRRRMPELPLIVAIFLVTLIPVLYFKGMSGAFFAERYLYIPTLALAFLIATLLDGTRWPHRYSVTWVVILTLAALTIIRNRDWGDSETLYRSALNRNPANAQFQNSLGDIELRRGNDASAREHFDKARQVIDDGVFYFSSQEEYRALIGLGSLAARAKNYREARGQLTQALQVNPAGDWAYLYLGGVMLESDQDYAGAIEYFEKAIELGPVNEVARDYLGIALLNSGQYREAARYFREALEINPNYEDGRLHLEMAERALEP